MKYSITFIFACFLVLMACTKEAEYDAAQGITYSPQKNAYRAVKISGTSTYWGEFTLLIQYSNDELGYAYRTNAAGDTVGSISVTRSGSTYQKYYISDYIPNIDQDSIERFDAELKAKYGAGNYELWDSLPKIARNIREAVVYLYPDGRIQKQINTNYRPKEDPGIGTDFDNSYILVSRTTYNYEYNLNSDVCVSRIMADAMDPTDKEKFERTLYKNETLFDGDRISGIISFIANGGDNFTEINHYTFTYNGSQLTSIKGQNFNRQFSYNGAALTITTDDKVFKYEYDSNGNVTKIDDGQGNVLNITYEPGNGNISIFTSLFDIQMGIPYIK